MERVRSLRGKALRYLFIKNEDIGTYVEFNLGVETRLANMVRNDELFMLIDLLNAHDDRSYAQSLAVSLYSTLAAKQLGGESPAILFRRTQSISPSQYETSKKLFSQLRSERLRQVNMAAKWQPQELSI